MADLSIGEIVILSTIIIGVLIVALFIAAVMANNSFRKGIKFAEAQMPCYYSEKELKQLILDYWAYRAGTVPHKYESLKGTPYARQLDEWVSRNKKMVILE